MYACHRTHHQIQKRTKGRDSNCKEEDHNHSQDRDEQHIDSYRYNYYYVWIFDSIGIIEPNASQNRALAEVGNATKKINWGRSREADTMKFWYIRTRGRGRSVLLAMAVVRLLEATIAEH